VVAKNCEWWRLRPSLFFPLEGQEHSTVSQTPAPRRSLQTVTDLTPPGIKFLLKSVLVELRMYGTVQPTGPLKELERFRLRKSGRDQSENESGELKPSFVAWPDEGRPVRVSAAKAINAGVVLVVEDEFLVRTEIADHLRDAGYDVLETATGEEAIALCKSDSSIDMVFTDINLAGSISGWDVVECFRMERPDASVLYTSANAIDPKRCGSRSVFIAKPYQHNDILNACQRLRTK
jgi:CheY-like chemotaxis protein